VTIKSILASKGSVAVGALKLIALLPLRGTCSILLFIGRLTTRWALCIRLQHAVYIALAHLLGSQPFVAAVASMLTVPALLIVFVIVLVFALVLALVFVIIVLVVLVVVVLVLVVALLILLASPALDRARAAKHSASPTGQRILVATLLAMSVSREHAGSNTKSEFMARFPFLAYHTLNFAGRVVVVVGLGLRLGLHAACNWHCTIALHLLFASFSFFSFLTFSG
jgi:hypothetical protein